jgi:hypothetical protein
MKSAALYRSLVIVFAFWLGWPAIEFLIHRL